MSGDPPLTNLRSCFHSLSYKGSVRGQRLGLPKIRRRAIDLPPMKGASLRHGFLMKKDGDGKDEAIEEDLASQETSQIYLIKLQIVLN